MRPRSQRDGGAMAKLISQNSVIVALMVLIIFGSLRYDHFLGLFNILTVLRYNSMFALISLGMCFVILSGGIDLSVGAVAALGSVVSALLSPFGLWAGLVGGTAAGGLIGLLSALAVTRLRIAPFIATLATMLAARGIALLVANNQSVSVSYDTDFMQVGQGDFLGFPIPAWITLLLFAIGSIALNLTAWGRYILAIGGNDDASRLMGLPVDRVTFFPLFGKRTTFRTGRRHACGAVRGRATNRRCRLGIVRNRVGRGRRHAAHGRARFSDHHLGRRASPWSDLQYTEFRKRSRLDQSVGLLAIGDSRSFSNVSCDVPVKVSFRAFSCQVRMNLPHSRGNRLFGP
jgi:predicted ABC-type sugar transport system permease subunit